MALDISWARQFVEEDAEPLRKSANALKAKAHGLTIGENGRGQARVNLALALAALRRKEQREE